MRLPVALWNSKTVYTDVELRAPSAPTIAATQEAWQKGMYRGVVTFLSGCVAAFQGPDGAEETNRDGIAHLVKRMPHASAETVAVYALLEGDQDDGIEGAYNCPRCDHQIICEYLSAEEDTRDHVRALPVLCQEQPVRTFTFTLVNPVVCLPPSVAGEPAVTATGFTMRYPTLLDCIEGENQVPGRGGLRQELAICTQAIEAVDGDAMTPGVLGSAAAVIMQQFGKEEMKRLRAAMGKWGIANTVRKCCPNCGKVWDATVNTTNFFVSALVS